MVLVKSRAASLATTSVAIVLFALGIALYRDDGASPLTLVVRLLPHIKLSSNPELLSRYVRETCLEKLQVHSLSNDNH